ncbi:hypothetical protein [Fluviispira sanaruensis]|uniref:HTH psq-type domain-containing protein n=1 Tax=Fluviispira sanaruensis TaxID=2493639 RepID=A0A4P2VP50_FLUSA|nr:hypothetical protein [Fluviispira sanaruensis]BBH54748.1 hypothetical protein JCM31447_32220 [Fluviispira sanaruensis]
MVKKKSVKSQYSLEFKNKVLEVLENSPKSMAQIAREFGVSYPTLNSWKRSNRDTPDSVLAIISKKNYYIVVPHPEDGVIRIRKVHLSLGTFRVL